MRSMCLLHPCADASVMRRAWLAPEMVGGELGLCCCAVCVPQSADHTSHCSLFGKVQQCSPISHEWSAAAACSAHGAAGPRHSAAVPQGTSARQPATCTASASFCAPACLLTCLSGTRLCSSFERASLWQTMSPAVPACCWACHACSRAADGNW